MINSLNKYILSIILLISGVNTYAQLEFKTYVDKNNISINDYIRFSIESNQKVNINNPSFENFTIVGGPSSSTSTSMSMINGSITRSSKHTTSYYLSPKNTGKITIGAAETVFEGKTYTTSEININVSKGTVNNNKQRSNSNTNTNNRNSNIFVKIKANKSSAYMGENIRLEYKLYTRYSRMQITDYKFPMTNGLWTEEIKTKDNKGWPQTREVINGMTYNVLTLKKEIVSPQKEENITIPAIKVTALINQSFFNPGSSQIIKSNSLSIKVKKFNNPPTEFIGQVGSNYKLNVKYSTNELKVDEPLDITITINGNGNIKQLKIPKIDYPQDFELFPEDIKENVKVSNSGISGKKVLSQLLIPRHHGTYTIPEISLCYFDLKKGKYITLSYPSQEIIVNKGENYSTNNNSNTQNKNNVDLLIDDIRHIEQESVLQKIYTPLFNTLKYWLLLFCPWFLLFIFFIITGYKRRNYNQEKENKKRANKIFKQEINTCKQYLSENNIDSFLSLLYTSWIDFISIKYSIPKSQINKQTLKKVFKENKITKEDEDIILEILDQIEMAKFAPLDTNVSEKLINDSIKLANKL